MPNMKLLLLCFLHICNYAFILSTVLAATAHTLRSSSSQSSRFHYECLCSKCISQTFLKIMVTCDDMTIYVLETRLSNNKAIADFFYRLNTAFMRVVAGVRRQSEMNICFILNTDDLQDIITTFINSLDLLLQLCVFDECAGHSIEDVITHSLWLCCFGLLYPREEKIFLINNLMFCMSLVFGTVVQSLLFLF